VESAILLVNTGMSYKEIAEMPSSRRKIVLHFVAKEKQEFYEFFKKLLGAK